MIGGRLKEYIRAATEGVAPVARLAAALGYRGKPMTDAKLTQKQQDFCLTYVTRKRMRGVPSSYNAVKMSQRSVENATSDLMKHPGVTVRLAQLRAKAVSRRASARHGLTS